MEQANEGAVYQAPLPFTAEEAEDELVYLATSLARQRLIDGTASNQLIAEVIKLGTSKERLQREKLKKENELLRAKTEAIQSQKNTEAFQARVLKALHTYAPTVYTLDDDDEYEYDE